MTKKAKKLTNDSVLVLNRYFLAVQVTTVQNAVVALAANKAKVVDQGYATYSLKEWAEITEEFSKDPEFIENYTGILHSPSVQIFAPQVIYFPKAEYTHPIIRAVKFKRDNIFSRDNYTCQYCCEKFSVKDLSLDHIVPRSRGGPNSWKNIVTACKYCNAKKDDKLLTEINWKLKSQPKEPKWRSHIGTPFSKQKRKYWNNFLK